MSLAYEIQLSKNIIQLVEQKARQANANKVSRIELSIGILSTVEVEILRFCFIKVSQKSIVKNAVLQINVIPGDGWCSQCQETFNISSAYQSCPKCSSYQITPTNGKGNQVKVVAIDVI